MFTQTEIDQKSWIGILVGDSNKNRPNLGNGTYKRIVKSLREENERLKKALDLQEVTSKRLKKLTEEQTEQIITTIALLNEANDRLRDRKYGSK